MTDDDSDGTRDRRVSTCESTPGLSETERGAELESGDGGRPLAASVRRRDGRPDECTLFPASCIESDFATDSVADVPTTEWILAFEGSYVTRSQMR